MNELIKTIKKEVSTYKKLDTLNLIISGKSENSQAIYFFVIKKVEDYFNKELFSLTEHDLAEYFSKLKNEGCKSFHIIKGKLSTIYKNAKMLDIIEFDPIERLKALGMFPKVSSKVKKIKQPLSKDELKYAISKCKSTRMKLILRLLSSTGMRIAECCNIEKKNITVTNNFAEITLTKTKNGEERDILILRSLYEEIMQTFKNDSTLLLVNSNENPYNTVHLTKQIGQVFEHHIGRKLHAHKLRHFFATEQIVNNKKDLSSISKYLGHKSIETTVAFYVDNDKPNPDVVMMDI